MLSHHLPQVGRNSFCRTWPNPCMFEQANSVSRSAPRLPMEFHITFGDARCPRRDLSTDSWRHSRRLAPRGRRGPADPRTRAPGSMCHGTRSRLRTSAWRLRDTSCRVGAGTYVRDGIAAPDPARIRRTSACYASTYLATDHFPHGIRPPRALRYDFRTGLPDASRFLIRRGDALSGMRSARIQPPGLHAPCGTPASVAIARHVGVSRACR